MTKHPTAQQPIADFYEFFASRGIPVKIGAATEVMPISAVADFLFGADGPEGATQADARMEYLVASTSDTDRTEALYSLLAWLHSSRTAGRGASAKPSAKPSRATRAKTPRTRQRAA